MFLDKIKSCLYIAVVSVLPYFFHFRSKIDSVIMMAFSVLEFQQKRSLKFTVDEIVKFVSVKLRLNCTKVLENHGFCSKFSYVLCLMVSVVDLAVNGYLVALHLANKYTCSSSITRK